MDTLKIIPGRVTAARPPHIHIEFEPDALPATNTLLTNPGGALVEVLRKVSPSEVLGVLRHGKAPSAGTTLTIDPRGLHIPPIGALWGRSLSPHGDRREAAGTPIAPLAAPRVGAQAEARQWALGHPGIDLTAPLMEGSSLAITGTGAAPERLISSHLPWAAASARARVLWVSGATSGAPPKHLDAASTIHLTRGEQPGESALSLRTAAAVANAASSAGHKLLIVLDDPLDALLAWRECEGHGMAAGQMAARHFEIALTHLAGPGRALIALLPSDPVRLGALAAGRYEPAAALASHAPFEGARYLPLESSSPWRTHLPAPQRALAERCLDALAGSDALSDHAMIFGEDELDLDQHSHLQARQRLGAWLEAMPESPLTLKDLTDQMA